MEWKMYNERNNVFRFSQPSTIQRYSRKVWYNASKHLSEKN